MNIIYKKISELLLKTRTNIDFHKLTLILLMISFVTLILFLNMYMDATCNSDDAGELILGKLLAEQRSFLSKDWFYSTELRVLNNQIIYALIFRLTNNFHYVRLISNIVLYCILLGSLYLFCHEAKLKKYFCYLALALILPYSIENYHILLRGAYYIPHITISLIIMYCMFGIYNENTGIKSIYLWISVIIAILGGLGGLRQVLILTLPLCLAIWTYLILNPRISQKLVLLYFSIAHLFASFVGMIINKQYLSKIYKFHQYDDLQFTKFSLVHFSDNMLNGILQVLGYNASGKIFSSILINNICAISIGMLIVVSIRVALKKIKQLDFSRFYFTYFNLYWIILFSGLISFTNMDFASRYFIPVVYFTFVLFVFLYKNSDNGKRTLTILLLVIIASTFVNYKRLRHVDINNSNRAVVNTILEHGCLNGYASFWQANILTELSNGKIEVWALDYKNKPFDHTTLVRWLQNKKHDKENPKGKMFLYLKREEIPQFRHRKNLKNEKIIYQNKDVVLYMFDDYNEFSKVMMKKGA